MEDFLKKAQESCIKTLYELDAVKINVDKPFVLKGGISSPVFCDTGVLECQMETRGRVASSLLVFIHTYLAKRDLKTDAYVGVVSGGISWASSFANCDNLPMLRAHAYAKNHGLYNQIEGKLPKDGSNVVVIDDVLTSGNSALSVVDALRKGKNEMSARILGVFTILDWNLASTNKKFEEAKVEKNHLLSMAQVLDYGFENGYISEDIRPHIQSFMDEHM